VQAGGDGFACPLGGSACGAVFDTAKEALEHAARAHGLSGERDVVDNKTCCLWKGCGKKVMAKFPASPYLNFGQVYTQEALHVKGPKPREGFVCPECDEAYATSAAAWSCAATHGVAVNRKKCLWAGCGKVFKYGCRTGVHESVRMRPPALVV
tara:strand:+ start:649 stop:1107 length:459 start_codon:yes stop_codon:yes gene_type:complete